MRKRYGYNEFIGTDIVSSDTMLGQVEALGFSCLSTQGANPSPSSPQTIYSTGDSGAIGMWSHKKNMFDISSVIWGQYNVYPNSAGNYTNSFKITIPISAGGIYSIRAVNSVNAFRFSYQFIDINGTALAGGYQSLSSTATKQWLNITAPINAVSIVLSQLDVSQANSSNFQIQLEQGTSATSYEPYFGNTPSITLPPGYIGGSLPNLVADTDLLKKVGKVVLNGSESWGISAVLTNVITFRYNGIMSVRKHINNDTINYMCTNFQSQIPNNWNTDIEGQNFMSNSQLVIRILKSRLTTQDVAGFKTWLASNNVTVYYELATPVDVSITIPSILTYEGANTITTTNNVKPTLTARFWANKK